MKRGCLYALFGLLAAITAQTVTAEVWIKEYQVEVVLGDGDSQLQARNLATEQIRQKAAAEAGTYIERTQELRNDQLTETIRSIGAALVRITAIDEAMAIHPSGRAVLKMTAKATVDESAIMERVKRVQQDDRLAHRLRDLETDNARLRTEVFSLIDGAETWQRQANKQSLADDRARLRRNQDALQENAEAVAKLFEPGEFVSLALAGEQELQDAKRYYDEVVFPQLKAARVTGSINQVRREGNGYVAEITWGWKFPGSLKDTVAGLDGKLIMSPPGMGTTDICFFSYQNRNGDAPFENRGDLLKHMIERGDIRAILTMEVTGSFLHWGEGVSYMAPIASYRGDGYCIVNSGGRSAVVLSEYQAKNVAGLVGSVELEASELYRRTRR